MDVKKPLTPIQKKFIMYVVLIKIAVLSVGVAILGYMITHR